MHNCIMILYQESGIVSGHKTRSSFVYNGKKVKFMRHRPKTEPMGIERMLSLAK